jgi:hypothetical protein
MGRFAPLCHGQKRQPAYAESAWREQKAVTIGAAGEGPANHRSTGGI